MTGRDWSFVIDANDRIVQVGERPGDLEPFLGHPVWDYLPHGEGIFGQHFEEARRSGSEAQTTVFYAGGTLALRIVPSGRSLVVHASRRTDLDVRTLGSLAASLRSIEAELSARAPARPDRRALGSRRALP